MNGSKVWCFPDGDLPPPGDMEPKGHESLMILNLKGGAARIRITVYYEERPPDVVDAGLIAGERVRCIRLDRPIGKTGFRILYGQYALRVDASRPVICQIGRMDVRQPNLAYYTVMGFPLDGGRPAKKTGRKAKR
jgi:hypothetical protein